MRLCQVCPWHLFLSVWLAVTLLWLMYSQSRTIFMLGWRNNALFTSRRAVVKSNHVFFCPLPTPVLAHGKYIFQKQWLKFIFQAVESACLTLIQFFSQGTSGVELKCTKLRYRFFCLFEPGIRSLEEFVRGSWEIMCVESEFCLPFAKLNVHAALHEFTV